MDGGGEGADVGGWTAPEDEAVAGVDVAGGDGGVDAAEEDAVED